MSDTVLQAIINGLLIGGFYALIGMGLNCIFGVMKIINFCQGELLMVGMYVAFGLYQYLGLDPYLAVPIVAVVMFLLGGCIQQTLITPSLKSENPSNLLFLTVGLGMLMQNLALMAFSADYRSIKTSYSSLTLSFLNLSMSVPKLVSFVALLVLTAVLFVFFKRTKTGKMIRATSQNRIGARLVGIRINWIYIVIYGLGAAIAGIAGCLLLPFYFVFPMVGATFSLRAYAVVVLGGLGNVRGAFVAGITLGLLETIGSLVVGPAFKDSIIFITFILILIVRQKYVSLQTR
ncbi:MAG: branched-chain amino acid ABC transporter permease [Planctomycetes bacterium]|nr:branched-chain amino acid ABC transporter permease [Planctomycetota bacterium]